MLGMCEIDEKAQKVKLSTSINSNSPSKVMVDLLFSVPL